MFPIVLLCCFYSLVNAQKTIQNQTVNDNYYYQNSKWFNSKISPDNYRIHSIIEDEDSSEENIQVRLLNLFRKRRVKPTNLDEAQMTVPDLIQKYHYPSESYSVTTEDGYILKLHRIPWGIKSPVNNRKRKPVAFLMHGIISSSAPFILNGPEQSLGYLLADAGYDVWMGNARGNRYSRNHRSLVPSSMKFWDFTWHEIGYYDLPAMIDFILNRTGQDKLYYIGHSQGTTVYYVMASEKPEYNDKIIAAFHLAPIVYLSHVVCPLLRLMALGNNPIALISDILGIGEYHPRFDLLTQVGLAICRELDITQLLCRIYNGYNKNNLNYTQVPVYSGHYPAGCSTKQLSHYGQIINSGVFRKYSFGPGNLLKYGSLYPPSYELGKCTAPIILIYSSNDWLSRESDIEYLYRKLPNAKMVKVLDPKFTHTDFSLGINAKEEVFDNLLNMMQNYSNVKFL